MKTLNLSDEDIETIITALKQKADWHTKNHSGKVDDAVVAWINSVIFRVEKSQ